VWISKLFWRLFFVNVCLSVALAFVFLGCLANWQTTIVLEQTKAALTEKLGGLIRAAAARNGELRTALVDEINVSLRESPEALLLVDEHGTFLAGIEADRGVLADLPEIQAALGGDTGQSISNLSQGRLLQVALPVRQGNSIIGALRVSRDLGDVDEGIVRLRQRLAIFVIVGTAIATITSYFVISRMVHPLVVLTEDAQAFAERGRARPLRPGFSGELGALARALDQIQQNSAERVERLEESAERLTSVLGNMAEGVVVVSPAESILLANAASRKLLEMTVADPIHRPLLEITRSLTVHAAFVEALRSPVPVEREFESTGSRRVLSLRAMRLPGQPCPGVMLVLHDVSELRRLENLRREFVANVSHELKTPLASIKAYAETLKMGALNDQEHGLIFVNRIEEQADRLHQLILDLIHLARVESGQEAFEIGDVDLGEIVQDCLDQHAVAAAQKQLRIVPIPPDDQAVVQADEEGMRTILSNLIDNAIKYTPAGGQIIVRWVANERGVLLEVQDTGIGIAERDQARIFERFYRADRARSREVGGTGLGLAIVKHLVQAFGGSVELESVPKRGSTFRIHMLTGRQLPVPLRAAPAPS
jgi:two-component system phosphate regulon sensor histidine kinase PhoR